MGIVGDGDWCYMHPYWINPADTLQSEFWHLELQDNKFFLDTYWVVIYWARHMKAKQMSLYQPGLPRETKEIGQKGTDGPRLKVFFYYDAKKSMLVQ